ncbi:hypothetical protein JTB14_003975 [Gonioctena quinquepunctata]|nr:hypothetical protein JTB14_003975 [Gonioctena quinquepunctata]
MSKEVEEIDSGILIGLVQDKPEIWDKATEDYKNRNKKTEACRSICAQLKENFENLSDGEKNNLSKAYITGQLIPAWHMSTQMRQGQQQNEELQSAADQADATKQTSQTPSAKILILMTHNLRRQTEVPSTKWSGFSQTSVCRELQGAARPDDHTDG